MMMAIARKPSRIAYSVVVWPLSRSRSSTTAIWSRIRGRIRTSYIVEVPPPQLVGAAGGRPGLTGRLEVGIQGAARNRPKGGFGLDHRRLAPPAPRGLRGG